jgi:hypothetical protein
MTKPITENSAGAILMYYDILMNIYCGFGQYYIIMVALHTTRSSGNN